MSMQIVGEEKIAAPIKVVWDALSDEEILLQCIPGCQKLEKVTATEFLATVTLKIGPMKASFSGSVSLRDIIEPSRLTLFGEGKGGIAGFANGNASVDLLAEDANSTVLRYSSEANVGGKLAQLGSRLVASTSKKLAAEFFDAFRIAVESRALTN